MYSLHYDTEIWPAWKTHGFFKNKKIFIKSPLGHDLKMDRDFIKNQTTFNKNHSIFRKSICKNHRIVSGKSHVGDGAASSKASSGKSHYSKYKHLGD